MATTTIKRAVAELEATYLMTLQTLSRAASVRLDRCRAAMLTGEPRELDDELQKTEIAVELLAVACGQVLDLVRAKRERLKTVR